ncbi:MAG TPA: PilZ domain-containing protein [Planctomycetaceae bacterium]|nr:PilZ domain-containing protein [Planctomycetaceae bacterium]
MADPFRAPTSPGVPAPPDHRRTVRLRSKSRVLVVRDTDALRSGLEGALVDVSCEGLGFVLGVPLERGEQIKIRVRNDVQRFEKEVRGIVRRVAADDEQGGHLIGVELRSRLTPLDVSMLRSGLIGQNSEGSVWV